MSFSDDEDDMSQPEHVNNFHFVDEKEEPMCFSVLPFQWEQGQSFDSCDKEVFLHGVSDDGLQKIYKQVTAWRLDLDGIDPIVYVLSKDKKWIQLMKPRKSFEDTVRKILITIHCIHYLKRNEESTESSLWDHVRKIFSHLEARASHDDILEHASFICKMIEKEDISVDSELITSLLSETTKNGNSHSEGLMNDKNSDFINDDDDDDDDDDNEESDDDSDEDDSDGSDDDSPDGFDSVCAICDEGGNVLCCEGKCLRTFHPTKGDGKDSQCVTLGYTKSQVDAIQNYQCSNCRSGQHQCFVCGNLGSSKPSSAEVFICANVYCGHFYHPSCVSKLLHKDDDAKASELEESIARGQKFICPFHKCAVCKKGEEKDIKELRFAMCRRCPTSYHRKCLPREISESSVQRAWFRMLPFNRILIYCMRHKIDKGLGTPIRDHLVFPDDPLKKKLPSSKTNSLAKRKAENLDDGRNSPGVATKMSKLKDGSRKKKDQTTSQFKRVKTSDIPKKSNLTSKADKNFGMDDVKLPVRGKPILVKRVVETLKNDKILSATSTVKKSNVLLPEIDTETEKRVLDLVVKSSASSLTLESFIKTKSTPTTHVYNAKHVDKSITLGKVEGSMEAVQTALQKIKDDDGNTENAKDVCEPGILEQIMKWRNKLGVYLGPFLHGMLYTSFGRHFTKIDKLKEIVDRLHWYVRSGDMIVDFCCGANDFSILMREKLEATGKKCQYKNFDVIAPRNDFMFCKKDWMKVRPSELSGGSQLIIGLNPPFGLRAALANKFIDKALEFKPKLLILIVPKETHRLDEKKGSKYDLIWEDDKKLSGKAFYLPGTVDAKDKQLEQWNVQPPPLYLWSRSDWTARHMDIAVARRHQDMGLDGREANTSNHKEHDHGSDSQLDGKPLAEVPKASNRETDASALKSNVQHKSSELISDHKRKASSNNTDVRAKKDCKPNQRNGSPNAEELNKSSDMGISPSREGDRLGVSPKPSEFESIRGQPVSILADDSGNGDVSYGSGKEILFSSSSLNRDIYGGNFGQTGTSEELLQRYKRDATLDEYSERHYRVDDRLLGQDTYPRVRNYGLQGAPDSLSGHDRENGRRDMPSQISKYGQQDVSNFPQGAEKSPGSDIHSLIRNYGQQDVSDLTKSRYTFGGTNIGLSQTNPLGMSPFSLSDPTIGTSAIDKYAPRLDDRAMSASGLGSSTMGMHAPSLDERLASRYAPDSQQHRWNDNVDSISFTGSQRTFSQRGTYGWLDD